MSGRPRPASRRMQNPTTSPGSRTSCADAEQSGILTGATIPAMAWSRRWAACSTKSGCQETENNIAVYRADGEGRALMPGG